MPYSSANDSGIVASMEMTTLLMTAFWAFLPISELRGAIPYAIANGIDWPFAFVYCVVLNALVAPVCWLFLATFHKLFLKMAWYRSFFDRLVERARTKIHAEVEKWGWLGIAIFVGIPLPFTGAWTGVLGAWILGLGKRKTLAAVVLGVTIAGVIVTAIVVLGMNAFDFFVKQV